jgi:hypothetical protein
MSGLLNPVWPRGPLSNAHKGFVSSGGSVGGLTNSNPVGLSRDVVHKIFYRARKIRYRIYLEYVAPSTIHFIYDLDVLFAVGGTYSIVGTSATPTGSPAFSSENELVSYPTGLGWCRSTGNDLDFIRDDVAPNRFSGSLYWPQFRVTKRGNVAPGYFGGRTASSNPADQVVEQDFVGTFFGQPIALRSFIGIAGSTFISAIFIFDFTTGTDCWWGYDPGDGGGPKWDTSDGHQLRFDI